MARGSTAPHLSKRAQSSKPVAICVLGLTAGSAKCAAMDGPHLSKRAQSSKPVAICVLGLTAGSAKCAAMDGSTLATAN